MKSNNDNLLDAVQKNKFLLKHIYSFQYKDRRVKVVFSDNPQAQTLEDALVKIATKRIG